MSSESPSAKSRSPGSGPDKPDSAGSRGAHAATGETRVTRAAGPANLAEDAPAWRDLPEHLRREMPAVTIGGYIYAANPADRSVIINSRLVKEGESVSPGLKLERMLPKEVVMDYRGQRYRVAY